MSLLPPAHATMEKRHFQVYSFQIYPIRTENVIKRRSCLMIAILETLIECADALFYYTVGSYNKNVIYNLFIYHFTGVVLAVCWEIHYREIQKLHFNMSSPENLEKKM